MLDSLNTENMLEKKFKKIIINVITLNISIHVYLHFLPLQV